MGVGSCFTSAILPAVDFLCAKNWISWSGSARSEGSATQSRNPSAFHEGGSGRIDARCLSHRDIH